MDEKVDNRIVEFINNHHVLTLATTIDDYPYCCNCYYVYDENENLFAIKINEDTRHGKEMKINPKIAASIVLETSEVGKIQGLQICGTAEYCKDESLDFVKKIYLKKYPYALAVSGDYVALRPNFYKFTDNRFGIGKKLLWNSNKKN